ncbi:MAG: FecR domain-containing protein [Deltaproteobacteria bacterium]|nr:FecR domain-containing protein [Deltaproteobacteria bacterium]
MTSRTVDQLAQLARKADAPALDDTASRRLVDAAIARARFEPEVAPRPSPLRWAAAGALAAAAVIAIVVLRAQPTPPVTMHVALPTGDTLTGTAGARFAIAELTPASRKLRVEDGTIVFDVAHVVAGQRFEVTAGDATVVATGTVFSVSSRGHVHVYEGSVEVSRAGHVERLAAGASSGAGEDPRELRDAGETAARARAQLHVASAPQAPVTTTRVVLVPMPVPVQVPVYVVASHGTEPAAVPVPASAAAPVAVPAAVPVPAPAPAADDGLALARADIAAGRYQAALDKVTAAPHPLSGAWLLVDADALRALGKKRDAADALASAAAVLDGTAQTEAAYSAAYLRWHELHDAAGALSVLTSADVDVPGSLFEERGLVLHIAILVATDRREEARPLAQRYLDHFPHGDQRVQMLALTRHDASK